MDSSRHRILMIGRISALVCTAVALFGLVTVFVNRPLGLTLIAEAGFALALTHVLVRRRINPSLDLYKRVRYLARALLSDERMVKADGHPRYSPIFVTRTLGFVKIIELDLQKKRIIGERWEMPAREFFLPLFTSAPFVRRAVAVVNPPNGIDVFPDGGCFNHIPQSYWSEGGLVYPESDSLKGLLAVLMRAKPAEPKLVLP